ncbi:uncharacterized protein LOC106065480 isoform X2 [Biomphalaria glabrata]|uniref:Uncharacterized protein LOC106065480 isoform X2 n=1 Tax=Biomphalaria glabrata TaxID=6526 RepID=A0A9W2ZCL1_BIOGL|nr:uncharacterized protein LOC106065480 isoform X2 [Biomphalaria glabrata]
MMFSMRLWFLYGCVELGVIRGTNSAQFGQHFILMFPANHDARLYFYTSILSRIVVNVSRLNDHDHFSKKVRVVGSEVTSLFLRNTGIRSVTSVHTAGAFSFFSNGKYSIIVLLLSDSGAGGDSFQAVPVTAFHKKYIVPTPSGPQYLICVTSVHNTVITIELNPKSTGKTEGTTYNIQEKQEVKYTVKRAEQSLLIEPNGILQQYTARVVTSDEPIGVVAGSYQTLSCKDGVINTSVVAEMLLSLDYYGLVYIVCKMQGGVAAGPVTVVTSSPFTNLQWKILKTVVRRNTLVNSGSRVEMLVNATMEVTADKPVGCFQIVFSPCRSSPDDFERVAMLQIVPVEMFFNFYSWSSLDTLNGSIQMHVYFIVQQSEIHLLTLKSTHPNSVYWDTNSEYQGWITGSLAVARGVSHAWMRNFNYFGCYVMGVAEDAIVAQLLGFQKSCIKGAQQDCDGYSDKGFQALIVDNGDDISQVCPEKTFGDQCEQLCEQCVPGCDPVSGICTRCEDGYTNILKACQDECPPMTFGKDCSGDCAKKCNDDCLNKVDGTCRATSQYTRGLRGGNSNSSVFFGLIWFFLPGCALCFLSYLLASYKTYSARR